MGLFHLLSKVWGGVEQSREGVERAQRPGPAVHGPAEGGNQQLLLRSCPPRAFKTCPHVQ